MSKYRVSIKLATVDALYNPSVNSTVFTVSVDSLKFSISGKQYILSDVETPNYLNIYLSVFYGRYYMFYNSTFHRSDCK